MELKDVLKNEIEICWKYLQIEVDLEGSWKAL